MGCIDPLRRGVGALLLCPFGSVSSYLVYADVHVHIPMTHRNDRYLYGYLGLGAEMDEFTKLYVTTLSPPLSHPLCFWGQLKITEYDTPTPSAP